MNNKDTYNDLNRERPKISFDLFKKIFKVFKYVKPFKLIFSLSILFLFLSNFTLILFPYILPKMTDVALGNSFYLFPEIFGKTITIDSRIKICIVLLIIVFFQSITSFARIYFSNKVSENVLRNIRYLLYNKIIHLPILFFESNRIGALISRINSDVTLLQELLSFTLAEFLRQILTLISGIIIILIISPKLTGVILLLMPILVLSLIYIGRFIKRVSGLAQQKLAEASTIVDETFTSVNMVKAYTNEMYESNRYKNKIDELMHIAIKSNTYRAGFVALIIFTVFVTLIYVAYLATGFVQTGEMTMSTLLSFITYSIFIGASIGGLGEMTSKMVSVAGGTERIMHIIEEEKLEFEGEEMPFKKLIGDIEFKEVSFNYPSRADIPIFNNLNFSIKAGEKIALVGPSGAGKSTIIQLLLQLYKLNKGNIYFDNLKSSEYTFKNLRDNMALVPQEVLLFGGSIKENIAYGKLDATDTEILEACKKANAWEFINRFPEKLETLVGERGVKLSGGQRQRIAIARAILKDPAILLLDEATSALDSESEKLVQDALEKLMEGRTSIIIAHRLSTIRNVDKIFVVNDGKIIEAGTHEELIADATGMYSQLLKLQRS
jgi:ABC-type multidrug transport system fused ATPase/permease subunit